MAKKLAVVLFNLGGPDSRDAIYPFLTNFFTDPNIIRLPYPLRRVIAWIIATRRTKKEAGDSYAALGGKSPLLENTQAQANALEAALNRRSPDLQCKVFIAMRYWHPLSGETAAKVKDFAPDEIVLLPLYPQYSTTTTRSSLQAWQLACKKAGLSVPTSTVCCYPAGDGFIEASARLIRNALDQAPAGTRVLFSAHGLPESIIREGDPYQWQCEWSASEIAAALGLAQSQWQICYQSRVGPKKWIGPSTDEALHKAAEDKVPGVLVYPHAFVSEHVETLVEIEQEYRHVAETLGIPWFGRVSTVGISDVFIDSLADMVQSSLGSHGLAPDRKTRLCPKQFGQCCMAEFPHGV